jgi:hypothetical protein
VSLLSQCQQGVLLDDQTSSEAFMGDGDVEIGVDPVVCSGDLLSTQVLTISSLEGDEPKVNTFTRFVVKKKEIEKRKKKKKKKANKTIN